MAKIKKQGGKVLYTTADYDKLPKGWEHDEWYREEIVYSRIRAMNREGYTAVEIADRIGCSNRTVNRVIQRLAA